MDLSVADLSLHHFSNYQGSEPQEFSLFQILCATLLQLNVKYNIPNLQDCLHFCIPK